MLRVAGHSITGQQDDNTGDQVALRPAVSLPAEPDTQQAGAPPDDAHRGVLEIVVHPWASPTMFRESVDASPGSDNERVEELLASTSAAQPVLTDEQQDSQKDTVGDEGTAHNEMRQALSQMVLTAESQGRDATEQHLHPTDNRHHLPHHSVSDNNIPTDPSMDSLGEMQLEIYAQHDLENEHQHQRVGKRGVDVLGETSALMGVAHKVGQHGDNGTNDLDRNVPSRADHLESDRLANCPYNLFRSLCAGYRDDIVGVSIPREPCQKGTRGQM